MNLPIAARNNAIVAVTSPDALDTRLAQAVSPPSVGGVSEPSTIKTLSGMSVSTGKVLQGELMFGRTGSGKPMFWLRGQGKNYALLGADGKPVTNPMDAEIRAIKLIQGGGATQLRQTSEAPGSNVKSRPRERFEMPGHEGGGNLAVDLTSKDVNSKAGEGRSQGGFLGMTNPGEPRSKLTRVEKEAAEAFKGMGVPVEVTNANPRGHKKNAEMHAVVRLSNDAIGGGQYARATINKDPGTSQPDAALWKLPKGASQAFINGYNKAAGQIAFAVGGKAVRDVAEGKITGHASRYTPTHTRPNVGGPTTSAAAQKPQPTTSKTPATKSVNALPPMGHDAIEMVRDPKTDSYVAVKTPQTPASGDLPASTGSDVAATPQQRGNPINNPAIRASISPVRVVTAPDGSVRLSKADGQPVTVQELARSVTNGRITPKQLARAKFDQASIRGFVSDTRALTGSVAPKPASVSDRAAYADVLRTLRNNPDVQKAMDHTLSPVEREKTNRALNNMAAKNVPRSAHVEPEGGGLAGSSGNAPFPAIKASKNILPGSGSVNKNKAAKIIDGAAGKEISPGVRMQLANLIGDKFPVEADMTKIAQVAGDLIKDGHPATKIAYALSSEVRNPEFIRYLVNSPKATTPAQVDGLVKDFSRIESLSKNEQERFIAELTSGETGRRKLVERTTQASSASASAKQGSDGKGTLNYDQLKDFVLTDVDNSTQNQWKQFFDAVEAVIKKKPGEITPKTINVANLFNPKMPDAEVKSGDVVTVLNKLRSENMMSPFLAGRAVQALKVPGATPSSAMEAARANQYLAEKMIDLGLFPSGVASTYTDLAKIGVNTMAQAFSLVSEVDALLRAGADGDTLRKAGLDIRTPTKSEIREVLCANDANFGERVERRGSVHDSVINFDIKIGILKEMTGRQ